MASSVSADPCDELTVLRLGIGFEESKKKACVRLQILMMLAHYVTGAFCIREIILVSSSPSSARDARMPRRRSVFRPCIDLHDGKVKQIVGGTLSATDESALRTNFVSRRVFLPESGFM